MSLLEIRRLEKSFADRLLFRIPELRLERGASYAVTGSNGVGKTTLLRILCGLEPAGIGEYRFDGRAVSDSAIGQLAPAVVYMHQHPYLFNTTVFANIAYGLKGRGLSRHEIAQRVERELVWAGLQDVAHIAPSKLSGGEKQRVALARARALQPSLLLLDEPTASLDVAARHQVVALISQMRNDNNCVLVATHDRELIELPWTLRYVLDSAELKIRD